MVAVRISEIGCVNLNRPANGFELLNHFLFVRYAIRRIGHSQDRSVQMFEQPFERCNGIRFGSKSRFEGTDLFRLRFLHQFHPLPISGKWFNEVIAPGVIAVRERTDVRRVNVGKIRFGHVQIENIGIEGLVFLSVVKNGTVETESGGHELFPQS